MGAINYGNNKNFINLGFDLRNYDELNYDNVDGLEYVYNEIKDQLEELRINDALRVSVEDGYYEGFYIGFDLNYSYFNDYKEKQETQKELTKIFRMLEGFIRWGWLVSYSAGWVTSYKSTKETLKDFKHSIKDFRKLVNDTPTEKNYFKNWSVAR